MTGLVFIIRKDLYVFGAFISAGLLLSDALTIAACTTVMWHFSLAGHFATPTKIDFTRVQQSVWVAGSQERAYSASMSIGGCLWLGLGCRDHGGKTAADIRSCRQYISHFSMPGSYTGVRDRLGDAVLGGSRAFMADEIEVLHLMEQ
ncbi:unnamed protein product [Vitrella brassicaformis CCMP3155]|uniref:Uncharacterized protein n=1 Tax=Vitrella brassicaformis (strain CCMP3155) TaxID=1169540 RepID=A0A0G4GTI5_VITBC|nr:unnamed protein product [Vitrella brassicaformis CCMP3155]|eukprot:CEM34035.1 unnamed protein product [Vitrella brassicaformis CCMP3155]